MSEVEIGSRSLTLEQVIEVACSITKVVQFSEVKTPMPPVTIPVPMATNVSAFKGVC